MSPHLAAPGFIIAGTRSGAGKTAVTLGVLRALRRRGCAVQPFKCGPDYIDPAFHEVAAGRPSFNLDSWAMGEGLIANLATNASAGADISIAEGVMGLFDGAAARGQCGTGATADLAALLGWPGYWCSTSPDKPKRPRPWRWVALDIATASMLQA